MAIFGRERPPGDRNSRFVSDMFGWGLLRDIRPSEQLSNEPPHWASEAKANFLKRRAVFQGLPSASSDVGFAQGIIQQYEVFQERNASTSPGGSAALAEHRQADAAVAKGAAVDAAARFVHLETPNGEVESVD